MPVTEEDILHVLADVRDPGSGGDVVSAGLVRRAHVRDGHVHVAVEVDPARAPRLEPLRKAVEARIAGIPGVLSATAVLTADRAPAPQQQRPAARPSAAPRGQGHGHAARSGSGSFPALRNVRSIVAVASGKGGVGKSTVATNLACALAAKGLRVGLLDADVYGPSLPRMLGIHERPESRDGNKLVPIRRFGIACMSIGLLVEEETPMIWRGPMVMGAVQQMLGDVEWGELDVLVLDMPPGTGDAQLTVAQRVPLAGAVIVSTPQDIALIDARKGLNMFRKVDVPVLGIVENMSTFTCPNCGHESHIFGHGGARNEASRLGVPFLGEVPLDPLVREAGDGGEPITHARPEHPQSLAFGRIAELVREGLAAGRRAPPRIVID